ncbi:MAG: EscU/YscU/HrcU family type III secretion system export apparatus switch protein [Bryobacteraceae bacterium]
MADQGQRTEQPTQRRLEKARREGNFPASREFVSSLQFLVFVALLATFAGAWFLRIRALTSRLLRAAFSLAISPEMLVSLIRDAILPQIMPLAAGGAVLVAVTVFAQLGMSRFGFATAKLAPDFNRLNPLSRMQSLPGQTIPMFLQAVALLPLVAFIVYYEVRENVDSILALPWVSVPAGVVTTASILRALMWRAAILFVLVGVIDLFWQRRRYNNQLRMTKHEVREEAKEQQGNPQIKMRVRKMQRDFARRQMMKEIPNATAVIVNPTHYAVAIRYSVDSPGAPKVVAKGKNYLALRIRQRATEHKVPIVENPPLARALYQSVDVGQEIPANLYRAVAEILAYIYRLMNGHLPG